MTVPADLRALGGSKARPTNRPSTTQTPPGLSRTAAAVGLIDSLLWATFGAACLSDRDKHPAEQLWGLLALAIAAGVAFVALVVRDTRIIRQWAAAFQLGRMSVMLERAAARSHPSRLPGHTPAAHAPCAPTPRTGEASEETSTR